LVAKSKSAVGSCVTVTLVKPTGASSVAPNAMLVVPNVIVLLVNALLGIFISVLADPLIDLFVSVSVVSLATNVSVDVGSVSVPVFIMLEITGVVSVLFVSVCVPDKVTTVESIAIVTAEDPLKLVPVRPVPIVNALVVLAVTVVELPRLTKLPLIVIELFVSDALAIFDKVLLDPLIDTPLSVVNVPPSDNESVPIVTELFVSDAFPILVIVFDEPLIDLFVSVCVPVNVTTVLSIAIVTAAEPS